MVPLPVPLVPLVIVTHGTELEAVQEHPAPAVTVITPVVGSAPTDTLTGEMW
jgi:hypothetical protein